MVRAWHWRNLPLLRQPACLFFMFLLLVWFIKIFSSEAHSTCRHHAVWALRCFPLQPPLENFFLLLSSSYPSFLILLFCLLYTSCAFLFHFSTFAFLSFFFQCFLLLPQSYLSLGHCIGTILKIIFAFCGLTRQYGALADLKVETSESSCYTICGWFNF